MFCVHFPAFKNADFEDGIVEASFLASWATEPIFLGWLIDLTLGYMTSQFDRIIHILHHMFDNSIYDFAVFPFTTSMKKGTRFQLASQTWFST